MADNWYTGTWWPNIIWWLTLCGRLPYTHAEGGSGSGKKFSVKTVCCILLRVLQQQYKREVVNIKCKDRLETSRYRGRKNDDELQYEHIFRCRYRSLTKGKSTVQLLLLHRVLIMVAKSLVEECMKCKLIRK